MASISQRNLRRDGTSAGEQVVAIRLVSCTSAVDAAIAGLVSSLFNKGSRMLFLSYAACFFFLSSLFHQCLPFFHQERRSAVQMRAKVYKLHMKIMYRVPRQSARSVCVWKREVKDIKREWKRWNFFASSSSSSCLFLFIENWREKRDETMKRAGQLSFFFVSSVFFFP